MMYSRRSVISGFLGGLLAAGSVAVSGDSALARSLDRQRRDDHDKVRDGVRRGQLVPMRKVVARIRRRSKGRMLDASLDREKMRYRIVWKTQDGDIEYITVDARSGRILSIRKRKPKRR